MEGDVRITEVSGEALPERILWILATSRYQTRLAIGSITTAAIMGKRVDESQAVQLPDNEDVEVFFGRIVLLLQGANFLQEVEFG